jgi:antitoxin CptB
MSTLSQDPQFSSVHLDDTRKRLRFRAWHRGTREMDLILGRFADAHLASWGDADCAEFGRLLENNDPDIYNWITGRENPPEDEKSSVLSLLLQFQFAT